MSQAIRLMDAVDRGAPITIFVDGQAVPAFRGESIAAAMLAAGHRTMRYARRDREPRGLYCGMGVCFECVVSLKGSGSVRSCLTPVEEGMEVWTTGE
jgi:sarcosine oxidase subunit alpha